MKKQDDKTKDKHPLDMTTDEAIEHLFGTEGAKELKEHANPHPSVVSGKSGLKGSRKSLRDQDSK